MEQNRFKYFLEVIRRYGILGILRLFKDFLLTRITWPSARLIRRPVYCRGIHAMVIGNRFTSGPGLRLDAFPLREGVVLKIGDDVQVNDYVHIAAISDVRIGNHVLIASRVFISDHNHGHFDDENPLNAPSVPPALRPLSYKSVHIENNVWIGESVCIMPGVIIGAGSVIGAGAVVTKNIPAGCVAVGNPARVIRRFDQDSCRWESVRG